MRKVKIKISKALGSEYVEGVFHQWGNGYSTFDGVTVAVTFAIVELKDGRIMEVMPDDVQFLAEEKQMVM